MAATGEHGLGVVRAIPPEKAGAWRQARLVYEGATIAELVADANRFDDRRIEIAPGSQAVAGLKLTGSFNMDDMEGVFATLEAVHPVIVDESAPGSVKIRAAAGETP